MGKGGFEKVDIGNWRSLEMVGEQEVRVGGGGGGTKKRGREEDGGDVVVGGGRSGKRSRGGRGRGEMLWTCVSACLALATCG